MSEPVTPAEWNELFIPVPVDWQRAYPIVEARVRANLERLAPGDLISTMTLMEMLYPAQFARGDGIKARSKMASKLYGPIADRMPDCVTLGEPQRMKRTHKYIRPRLWHAPKAKDVTWDATTFVPKFLTIPGVITLESKDGKWLDVSGIEHTVEIK